MEQFRKLGLIEPILKAIQEENILSPTQVQEKSIPHILSGKDVVAGSATGSGKTLAFASGIIQNCERGRGLQSLVLTPTRELAEQVTKSIKMFSRHKPLNAIAVFGGVSIDAQMRALRTADVVVATPGRLLDHLERRSVNLSQVKILVLDEADRMLDMGFIPDVTKIIKNCPANRQTLFFSATITSETKRLTDRYMKNAIEVQVESMVDPKKLKQVYYDVNDNMKFSVLVHLLKSENSKLVMVFCNSRDNVDFVTQNLKAQSLNAIAIHGGLSQDKRSKTLNRFNAEEICVLVCTDVAARGLDIKGVTHVYNYDIPRDSSQYIHRIGRTARAGHDGIAISILSPRDHDNFSRVLRYNDFNIESQELSNVERVQIQVLERRHSDSPRYIQRRDGNSGRPRSGGFSGRRDSNSDRPRSGGFSGRRDSNSDRPRSSGSSTGRSEYRSEGRSEGRDEGFSKTRREYSSANNSNSFRPSEGRSRTGGFKKKSPSSPRRY